MQVTGEVVNVSNLREVQGNIQSRNGRISLLSDILSVLCRPYYPASCGTSFTNEVLMNVESLISRALGIVESAIISFLT
jgi:hypothetical protein